MAASQYPKGQSPRNLRRRAQAARMGVTVAELNARERTRRQAIRAGAPRASRSPRARARATGAAIAREPGYNSTHGPDDIDRLIAALGPAKADKLLAQQQYAIEAYASGNPDPGRALFDEWIDDDGGEYEYDGDYEVFHIKDYLHYH